MIQSELILAIRQFAERIAEGAQVLQLEHDLSAFFSDQGLQGDALKKAFDDLKYVVGNRPKVNQCRENSLKKENVSSLDATPNERKKILFVTSLFPSFRHGGGLRLFDFIVEFSKTFDVYIYSVFSPWLDGASYNKLCGLGIKIHITNQENFSVIGLRSFLKNENACQSNSFFVAQLEYDTSVFFDFCKEVSTLIAYTLMESLARRYYMEYLAAANSSSLQRVAIKEMLRRAAQEAKAFSDCNACFCVTSQDLNFSVKLYQPSNQYAVVETAISNSQFDLRMASRFWDKSDVLFVGNFLHTPNLNAILWYLENVHPFMQHRFPEYKIRIVGNGPSKELLSEFQNDLSVNVVGWVDNLQSQVLDARVCIAPIISGAGIRGKVIQYAAMGCPTVTTSLGGEGLEELSKTGGLILADTPENFFHSLAKIYNDPQALKEQALQMRQRTLIDFDVSYLVKKILNLYYAAEQRIY